MLAARGGYLEAVEVLIAAGANLDLTAKFGLSATMLAVVNDHQSVARILAAAGADLSIAGSGAPGFAGKTAAALARDRGRIELAAELAQLRQSLRADATLWISWPKKASKQPTDIDEQAIRDLALPLGFVDVKVCAIDATWSGLKLVVRKALR